MNVPNLEVTGVSDPFVGFDLPTKDAGASPNFYEELLGWHVSNPIAGGRGVCADGSEQPWNLTLGSQALFTLLHRLLVRCLRCEAYPFGATGWCTCTGRSIPFKSSVPRSRNETLASPTSGITSSVTKT